MMQGIIGVISGQNVLFSAHSNQICRSAYLEFNFSSILFI